MTSFTLLLCHLPPLSFSKPALATWYASLSEEKLTSWWRLTSVHRPASIGTRTVSNDEKGDGPAIAAFDIGSNTIKMTVARQDGLDHLTEFLWRSETVRLGAGIDQSGRLADDRIEAAADTIHRFAAEARAQGATRLIGVATEATRVAENGQTFLDRIRSESGIELSTISGDREAELTFQGLAAA